MKGLLIVCAIAVIVCLNVGDVAGHGMLLDPPGRSSRWRYDTAAPINYDDNGLNCGGFSVQWDTHNGKCGLCGDDYGSATPRSNELGGKYGGVGVITKTYTTRTVTVSMRITANHVGYVYFELCNLDVFGTESEECFKANPIKFVDGSEHFYIGTTTGGIDATIVFPQRLNCQHCVLRWIYRAGNNWGYCEDGTGKLGCGPQEHFISCSDISINASSSRSRIGKFGIYLTPTIDFYGPKPFYRNTPAGYV